MRKHPGDCAGDPCRSCWLADNDERYRAIWARQGYPSAKRKSDPNKPRVEKGTLV